MSTVETRIYSADDLMAMPDSDRLELVNGELGEKTVSLLSSWVGGELHGRVREFVRLHDQGMVWPADSGCQFLPDSPATVRKPDVLFVRKSRIPLDWQSQGFLRIAPDLVVIGEVGLSGELRTVAQAQRRLTRSIAPGFCARACAANVGQDEG